MNGKGSNVGPDLSAVAKEKDRRYLLESIITPNAKIAKGFETAIFVMDDGLQYAGIVKGEDDTSYQIQTAQGEMIRIVKANVDVRAEGRSGMPDDIAKPLSKHDIRDLVEYLSTLKVAAPVDGAHGK